MYYQRVHQKCVVNIYKVQYNHTHTCTDSYDGVVTNIPRLEDHSGSVDQQKPVDLLKSGNLSQLISASAELPAVYLQESKTILRGATPSVHLTESKTVSAGTTQSVQMPESEDVGSVDVGSVDLGSVDLSGCGEWTKTCEKECVDGGGPIQIWCTSSKLIMASAFTNGSLFWQQEKLSSQRRYLYTV